MLTVDEQMQDTFRGFQRALLLGENDCCILTVDVKNLNNHTFIDEKLKWIHFHLFAAVVPLSRSTTMHLKRHAQKLLFIGASGHRLIAKSERIQNYIGMVAILGTQIWWTWQVEEPGMIQAYA